MVAAPLSNEPVSIAVSGSLCSSAVPQHLNKVLTELAGNVFAALRYAGAEPHFLEASRLQLDPAGAIANVQALLILGGADADPHLYGHAEAATSLYGVNRDADHFEMELCRLARLRRIPILGICRGMQLINIAFGGDLIQDLGRDSIHYVAADNASMTEHLVRLEPDTRLRGIYGERELSVLSGHHQAVRELGRGLRVGARAPDGMIESIEADGPDWVIGVQWHPEATEASQSDRNLLFRSFVAEAMCRNTALT
ncbi:gamma-glutamyl-gamma-aminobutyrate hydrolase family protein [Paracoccus versutus]|uniref:Putative glutamine amidotransferase n=1 Tax=Paracoccus versutus TaxID=34007 RepID=A0A3D9XSK9_PARVE|nr:gamma-glutamyl-gamma-aminobutyrate hydrolase family protein [Paracoccus versutus]REF73427.1 putative glutamine amidotransferase [Paracoccus versutus]WGR54556.1 gamma-glutamyl-gamma-aminobutyrate hydrolase family protein [Paracoccus versutus]